jgi:hypothetical protein
VEDLLLGQALTLTVTGPETYRLTQANGQLIGHGQVGALLVNDNPVC